MNSFVAELIGWIEKNLDKKLVIDDVASRAGYSKWHLQRLFRRETGMTLATYIRKRRLSESAILLKMTNLPVIDTAEKFGFSNQQAFTRTFTGYFSRPPASYRQSRNWSFTHLQPSLIGERSNTPPPEVVRLSPPPPEGITLSYLCPADKICSEAFHAEQYQKAWRKAEEWFHAGCITYISEQFIAAERPDSVTVYLTFSDSKAQEPEHQVTSHPQGSAVLFLRFPFEGDIPSLMRLKSDIYQVILPGRCESRRDAHDLFIFSGNRHDATGEGYFSGFYHVPVTKNGTV